MLIQLALISSLAAATPPEAWTKWVAEQRQELQKEYAGETAKDLKHFDPKTKLYVSADGKGSWRFATTAGAKSLAVLEWDGAQALTIDGAPAKLEKGEGAFEQFKLPVTQIKDRIAVDGFKRPADKYMITFLYDPNRKEIGQIRAFNTFDYDSSFKTEAHVERIETPVEVTIPASRGEPKHFKKQGVVTFTLKGHKEKLTLMADQENTKFVMLMFKDDSNGTSTYGGGRFLDVELAKPLNEYTAADTLTVDFNFAHNPPCARSAAFMCPIPQERLHAPVNAGEKKIH